MQCSSEMEWIRIIFRNIFPIKKIYGASWMSPLCIMISPQTGNASDDGKAREKIRDESDEVLLESDYELDEEQPVIALAEKVNYDFRFGKIERQEVREDDTDYRDSDELRSLSSVDEEETSSKKRSGVDAFNPTTDMDEPLFRT
ncbi:Uncharacterized protein Adt_12809 [Abeliophyllum distichum]|uniref:Uncharacterized protein n=1 Tax=Abeliophyllum distichum TaxID=126358 RepID=A0ABD1URS7_9LAMI